jgi:hypothetical protein
MVWGWGASRAKFNECEGEGAVEVECFAYGGTWDILRIR